MHLPAERRIFRKSRQFGRCVFFIDFGRVPCYTRSGMFPAGGNWPCRAQVSIAAGRGLPLTSATRAAILPSEEFPCISLVARRPAAVVGGSLLTFEAEIGILLSEGFGEVTPECVSAEKGVLLTTFFFFARRLLPAFSVPLHFPLQFLHDLPPFRWPTRSRFALPKSSSSPLYSLSLCGTPESLSCVAETPRGARGLTSCCQLCPAPCTGELSSAFPAPIFKLYASLLPPPGAAIAEVPASPRRQKSWTSAAVCAILSIGAPRHFFRKDGLLCTLSSPS